MASFSFQTLNIPGAYEITSFYAEDHRGSFVKTFEQDIFREYGIPFHCNEDFTSVSAKNVIRGMHFQLRHPQAKLVSVLQGEIYDVLVDLRRESPAFGQWYGAYLSSGNHKSLYIPKGCAHGFLALVEDSVVNYKCDGPYDPETDSGILYNDAEIAIAWPLNDMSSAILGKRDQEQMSFQTFRTTCDFVYDPHTRSNITKLIQRGGVTPSLLPLFGFSKPAQQHGTPVACLQSGGKLCA